MDQPTVPASSSPAPFVMTLELVGDKQGSDPAFVNAVGYESIDMLQQAGYTVRPVYTGQKGGGFLVEVVTTVTQLATAAWDHRAAVEEVVNDLSSLVTIFGVALPVLKKVFHAYEERVGKEESVSRPIKMTLEIDGSPIVIEAAYVKQAEAILALARRFHSAHPVVATHVNGKSSVKMKGRVPARKQRRRR
jgi:hypothetical protein